MKGLDEINEENKKADVDKTKVKIKLDNGLTITQGSVDSTLQITKGEKTIKFTSTVLRVMLEKHNTENNYEWDINDKILKFLHKL